MTTDITGTSIAIVNGTVVAIQGNAVKAQSLGSNQDGYILTWVNGNNDWEAVVPPTNAIVGLQSQTFNSDGYWTCPANVFNVWLNGFGGGGGGAGGNQPGGGGGGGGSIAVSGVVSVVPGTTYSVVVGTGGTGGVTATTGNDGAATSFGTNFYAQGAGKGWTMTGSGPVSGGGCNIAGASTFAAGPEAGVGGGYNDNGNTSCNNWSGNGNYTGGTKGAQNTYGGGGGGGAGPGGNGANGGAGHAGLAGVAGSAAAANTGAGGGAGGSSDVSGGAGGNGGSGQLTISWIG